MHHVDDQTRRALAQAAAKTVYSIGIFLLIAAGWGYITAASDPGHDTGDQLVMVVVGLIMAVAGRVLRTRLAGR